MIQGFHDLDKWEYSSQGFRDLCLWFWGNLGIWWFWKRVQESKEFKDLQIEIYQEKRILVFQDFESQIFMYLRIQGCRNFGISDLSDKEIGDMWFWFWEYKNFGSRGFWGRDLWI